MFEGPTGAFRGLGLSFPACCSRQLRPSLFIEEAADVAIVLTLRALELLNRVNVLDPLEVMMDAAEDEGTDELVVLIEDRHEGASMPCRARRAPTLGGEVEAAIDDEENDAGGAGGGIEGAGANTGGWPGYRSLTRGLVAKAPGGEIVLELDVSREAPAPGPRATSFLNKLLD